MKSILNLSALLAIAAAGIASGWENNATKVVAPIDEEAVPDQPTEIFKPLPHKHVNKHDHNNLVPKKKTSFYYSTKSKNKTADAHITVNHTMKYPSVMLEDIAAITEVDCTPNSVKTTFNDTKVFERARAFWYNNHGPLVLVTNHLGDCDSELDRAFFIATSVKWDAKTLVAIAYARKADVSSIATQSEISFGDIAAGSLTPVKSKRSLDPSMSFSPTYSLSPNTTLFSQAPYVDIKAEKGLFASNVTLSGYLRYDWLGFKLKELYFDLDADFNADLVFSASVEAEFATSFEFAAPVVAQGIAVPGVLELGPMLEFSVGSDIGVSAAVDLSTEFKLDLAGANVHIDVMNKNNTAFSGWVPTYSASADLNVKAQAHFDPYAALTVQVAANAFGGLLDLSTGVVAKAEFENQFSISAEVAVDENGIENTTGTKNAGVCPHGIYLESEFLFSLDVFATEWYSASIVAFAEPFLEKCYSWDSHF
ncbi:hypothetical protein MBM_03417 [Drepanopeziza brunnea f. sp. 'multigermtubi' MB_m1]|uniref:Isoamyl alcohol n=1 Tax=Marssonina brunnea f. sp. multigermtubi (strain MB_m1) TaxID=1072389 RepID=K1XZX7_MARBU|nr:uncharacterized protein MBM_03417 [Drepanopeziza brunnea f. sp. 'multigermtubi' MB_m1]EKD18424.1 hypothetical protein MBM_03417 [Drepanopeziza brunnea f. sp. 'multigermtubi' MB_m1]